MKNKLVLLTIATLVLVITTLTITAYADTPAIPQWIKNNAKWWSEGTIGDADFLKAIQYLVQQGIIRVPTSVPTTVKEITATNGIPSDSDRVMSMVVTFQNFANFPSNIPSKITINSFQRISEGGQITTGYGNTGTPTTLKTNPEFKLDDLPSKDKAQFYQFLNPGITAASNTQSTTELPKFDVIIDLYTGDGTLLHSLEYDKCNLLNYWVYTDSNKMDYRMASSDQAEDREASVYTCQGYHLILPNK